MLGEIGLTSWPQALESKSGFECYSRMHAHKVDSHPTANTGVANLDAFLWVKPGAESDGQTILQRLDMTTIVDTLMHYSQVRISLSYQFLTLWCSSTSWNLV